MVAVKPVSDQRRDELALETLHSAVSKAFKTLLWSGDLDDVSARPASYKSPFQQFQVVQSLSLLQVLANNGGHSSEDENSSLLRELLDRASLDQAKQALLPEVESQLSKKAAWIAHITESSDTDSLVEELEIQMATLSANQQQHVATVENLGQELAAYLKELSDFGDQQRDFLTMKLNAQQELDKSSSNALKAAAQAGAAQAEVTEARVLVHNYTPDSILALKKVSRHLHAAEKEAELKHSQLEAKLHEYEELGPNFVKLARDYHQLQRKLDNAIKDLEDLRLAHREDYDFSPA